MTAELIALPSLCLLIIGFFFYTEYHSQNTTKNFRALYNNYLQKYRLLQLCFANRLNPVNTNAIAKMITKILAESQKDISIPMPKAVKKAPFKHSVLRIMYHPEKQSDTIIYDRF